MFKKCFLSQRCAILETELYENYRSDRTAHYIVCFEYATTTKNRQRQKRPITNDRLLEP